MLDYEVERLVREQKNHQDDLVELVTALSRALDSMTSPGMSRDVAATQYDQADQSGSCVSIAAAAVAQDSDSLDARELVASLYTCSPEGAWNAEGDDEDPEGLLLDFEELDWKPRKDTK
jgi:hypothetical protein